MAASLRPLKPSLIPPLSLARTIPTMLLVGLAYDLVPPLRDVSLLLPLTLIFAAFAYDVVLWMKPEPAADETLQEEETAAGDR